MLSRVIEHRPPGRITLFNSFIRAIGLFVEALGRSVGQSPSRRQAPNMTVKLALEIEHGATGSELFIKFSLVALNTQPKLTER